jgi:putative intracellular protease/amidase
MTDSANFLSPVDVELQSQRLMKLTMPYCALNVMPKGYKALILTADKFEDMELFFPYFRLLEEGLEVDIAAPQKGNIEGEHGYGLEVHKTFDDVRPGDYDLL